MEDEPDRFTALFADLEAQMSAQQRRDRLAQLPDLVRESFAELTLAQRLAGAIGDEVELVANTQRYAGRLERVGRDWVLLDHGGAVVIALRAVSAVKVGTRDVGGADLARGLGMGSPLRELQERGGAVRAVLRDGGVLDGWIDAVAADYVQLRVAQRLQLVPFTAIDVVRSI